MRTSNIIRNIYAATLLYDDTLLNILLFFFPFCGVLKVKVCFLFGLPLRCAQLKCTEKKTWSWYCSTSSDREHSLVKSLCL